MSSSRNQSFFKIYAKNSYINKINPEYDGITKKYYNQKREHQKIHSVKTKLNKEVAYVQRIQQQMQYQLQKKKKQLQFAKQINHRLQKDHQRKQWLNQYKQETIQNNQKNTKFLKSQSQSKLQYAKLYMTEHRQSVANLNRDENKQLKEKKSLKKAKEWDDNKSRVSQIQKFKKHVLQNTNKFYQTRNASSLSSYNTRIKSYKQFQAIDNQKIKELQKKKLSLKEKYEKDQTECDEISKEIQRIKRQSKLENSLVRSRLRSRSSLSAKSDKSLKNTKLHSKHKSDMLRP